MKRTATYTTLSRQAAILLGCLAYLAERSTDPDRIERVINRAYARWHRRACRRAAAVDIVELILADAQSNVSLMGYTRWELVEALDVAKHRRLATHGMPAWRLLKAISTIETYLK